MCVCVCVCVGGGGDPHARASKAESVSMSWGLYDIIHLPLLFTSIKTPKPHSCRHKQLSIPQVILSNLALALLLFYTTFLAGSIQIGKYLLCRIFSALSLYFLFVSFGWMLVEGVVHFYVTAIVLCNFSRRHVLYVMIATWGEWSQDLHLTIETTYNRYNIFE